MIRKATAVWRGTARDGVGSLTTDSGVLESAPLSFRSRFEGKKGTNPEELLAAAHAGCFTMSVAFQLQSAGYVASELSAEAAVSLEAKAKGFAITRSALSLRAVVPDIDDDKFQELARAAELYCPVSQVLGAEVTLDAKLVPASEG